MQPQNTKPKYQSSMPAQAARAAQGNDQEADHPKEPGAAKPAQSGTKAPDNAKNTPQKK